MTSLLGVIRNAFPCVCASLMSFEMMQCNIVSVYVSVYVFDMVIQCMS